jgi:hypothetical protein
MQYGLQLFAVAMILAHGGGVAAGGSGNGGRQTDANRFWRTLPQTDNRQHEADSFEGCTVPYISQHCVVNSRWVPTASVNSRRTLIAIDDQQSIIHNITSKRHHINGVSLQRLIMNDDVLIYVRQSSANTHAW